MRNIELKYLCSPKQWKTVAASNLISNGYPVYGANGIIGYHTEYNHEFPTILVTCRGATCGEVNICKPFSYVNGNAMALDDLDVSKINIKYLYYYLKHRGFKDIISGSAQPQIIRSTIEKIKIPLIELEIQEKIVETLDKVNCMLSKRQSQIVALDELIQSLYLEMLYQEDAPYFVKIGEVIESIEAGWSVSGEERTKLKDELAVLKISAVTKGYFNEEEYKVIKRNTVIKKAIYPKKGDILFSRANTRELVGASAIVPKNYTDLILPDKLWKINLVNGKLTPEYFHTVINTKKIRNKFSKNATGTSGSMLNISMQKFKEVEIPLPSLEQQVLFSSKFNQISEMKIKLITIQKQMEQMYGSLLQKAFKGELFQE
ncbi:hypothetical protein LYSIN_03369 [Lysinibacillus sphaericus]|uniref:Type I restriction modification DNA specificity domain-containing protein n=1 Tax=Lysinibacillus sphaericus TaxID=1421 RepID=A0A2S5CWF5_LYSSH|nr:restriction endonuclease subunit S [Lysinibacillus sphaericus]POZ55072.1 hypothetical protein LYSIN_03369 [Lysinibacillus sphaericus]